MLTKRQKKVTPVKVAKSNKVASTVKLYNVKDHAVKFVSDTKELVKEYKSQFKNNKLTRNMFARLTQNVINAESNVVNVLSDEIIPSLKFCRNSSYVINRLRKEEFILPGSSPTPKLLTCTPSPLKKL